MRTTLSPGINMSETRGEFCVERITRFYTFSSHRQRCWTLVSAKTSLHKLLDCKHICEQVSTQASGATSVLINVEGLREHASRKALAYAVICGYSCETVATKFHAFKGSFLGNVVK